MWFVPLILLYLLSFYRDNGLLRTPVCVGLHGARTGLQWIYIFFKDFIYERASKRETQAKGEADSMQGAWCGTRFQVTLDGFFLIFYLFMKDTREREREVGSMQEARHGTRSQVSKITPWAKGGTKPLSHRGCPCPRRFDPTPSSCRNEGLIPTGV